MEVNARGYRTFNFSPGINAAENSCHAVPYDPNLAPPSTGLYEDRAQGCEMRPFNSQRPAGMTLVSARPSLAPKHYSMLGKRR